MNWSIHFGDERLIDLSQQEGYQFPHPVQGWVMPVLALWFDGNKVVRSQALGTAFAIGPQLVATAKHVVDGIQENGAILHVLFLVPGNDEDNPGGSMAIPITAVGFHDAFDVAVMSCAVPSEGPQPKFSCAPLTVRYPDVGQPLLTLGYAKSHARVAGTDTRGKVRIEVNQRLLASRGYVGEHHPEGRDSVMITFPAMQGDYPALPGMSGGPVITETGQVCGLVSTSVDGLDGSWTSTCALLAPLFVLRVQCNVDGVSKLWTIRELAEHGIVTTDGSHTKVHSEWDPQANELRFKWSPDP